MLRTILVTLALTLSAVPVAAGTIDDASAAYYRGDYKLVMRLVRPLAEQGNAEAQSILGLLYNTGQGVPVDYAEAARWLRRAAEQGKAPAQFGLGGLYANGQGVPQDYVEAARWYRRSAEQGFAVAQTELGVFYANGQGVPRDDVLAYMWFNLSAAQGLHDVPEEYSASFHRDEVAKFMTREQIAEAQRMAREWKPK